MEVPLLLLTFNRPDLLRQQLEWLRPVAPNRVYVSSDGPRLNRPDDAALVRESRRLIDTAIDWPCRLIRKYEPANLGCGLGVSSAISWFFSMETEGIILEDDCHLSPTYFQYARDLLSRYRDDTSIGGISADFKFGACDRPATHYATTRFPQVWGWATWRRVWEGYDFRLNTWTGSLSSLDGIADLGPAARAYWIENFNKVKNSRLDTWDFQLTHLAFSRGYRFVHPLRNLVSNIGFRRDATHTRFAADKTAGLPFYDMSFPLIYDPAYSAYDHYLAHQFFVKRSLARKIVGRAAALLRL